MKLHTATLLLNFAYATEQGWRAEVDKTEDDDEDGGKKKKKKKGKGGKDNKNRRSASSSPSRVALSPEATVTATTTSASSVAAEEPGAPHASFRPPRAANPNLQTLNKATPIIVICRKSQTLDPKELKAFIDLLLERGANVNARSTDGMTALMWATLLDDKGLVQQLLFAGANPLLKDSFGHNPLEVCKSSIIRMLLKGAMDAQHGAQQEA